MKIALVIKQFNPARGGAEHWTWQYAQWLLAQGHEVHVAAGGFAADVGAPRVAGREIVPHLVSPLHSPLAWADAAAHVAKALRADVIHDMGSGWYCDVFQPHGGSRVAAFEQNLLLLPSWVRPFKRLVVSTAPRYREFERLTHRQYADDGRCVIALSQMVASHMRQHYGLPPERLRLVYNGVDIDRFSPDACRLHRAVMRRRLGIREETLFLIVAHNYRLKGVPTLLRAVSRLRQAGRSVHLIVAGRETPRMYQHLAQWLGVASAVSFVGPHRDVVPYYAAADVYVQPTFYDPCSLVVLEAMACGLPVVTSRFNGASEFICGGAEGCILDDPADAAELAQRLEPLLDDDVRARKGAAARRRAELHSWERNCQEILAVYPTVSPRRQAA